MNPKQRLVLIIGGSAVALSGLIPPWHHYVPYMRTFVSDSFRPIWQPPFPGANVDTSRLLIEWFIIAVITITAFALLRRKQTP
jgi:hypothetical protein